MNSEKSTGRLAYGEVRLDCVHWEWSQLCLILGPRGKVFRHGHWEGLRLKYLLLVGTVTLYFWEVKYAKKCSEESTIC